MKIGIKRIVVTDEQRKSMPPSWPPVRTNFKTQFIPGSNSYQICCYKNCSIHPRSLSFRPISNLMYPNQNQHLERWNAQSTSTADESHSVDWELLYLFTGFSTLCWCLQVSYSALHFNIFYHLTFPGFPVILTLA